MLLWHALAFCLPLLIFDGCSVAVRLSHSRTTSNDGERSLGISINPMTTEIRNWAVVAASMEAQGATNSQMYLRAKALAEGKSDPMPTSFPAAPFSISTV